MSIDNNKVCSPWSNSNGHRHYLLQPFFSANRVLLLSGNTLPQVIQVNLEQFKLILVVLAPLSVIGSLAGNPINSFFFFGLGFELRALHLQSRCSTA
jgi:hypothetical protein